MHRKRSPDHLVLPSSPDHVVQNIIEGDVRPHDNVDKQKGRLSVELLAADPVTLSKHCRLSGQYDFILQILQSYLGSDNTYQCVESVDAFIGVIRDVTVRNLSI